jgi:hypothetical protein
MSIATSNGVALLLAACAGALLLAAACANGDNIDPGEPTETPSERELRMPRIGGIEAARAYLHETGLNGKKGALTDPIDCEQLPERGVRGQFCIYDAASHYAPGLVVLFVADVRNRERDVWQMSIELRGSTWEVVRVESARP